MTWTNVGQDIALTFLFVGLFALVFFIKLEAPGRKIRDKIFPGIFFLVIAAISTAIAGLPSFGWIFGVGLAGLFFGSILEPACEFFGVG